MTDFSTSEETPLPVEFIPEERRRLLEDIGFLCLSVNQASADKTLAFAEQDTPHALLAAGSPFMRLQRLDQLLSQILPLILAIAKQPDTVLNSQLRRLPLDRLRGVASVMNEIARSPHAQQSLIKPRSPVPNLPEARAVLSSETTANRLVAAFLHQIAAETKALARLAAFCADAGAESHAQALEHRVNSLLSQELWRTQPSLPPSQFNSLLPVCHAKSPLPYRLIFDAWQSYLAASWGVDWSGLAAVTVSERALWQIYEIWCFLQIGQAMQSLGWNLRGETQIQITADGMHLVPATGRASCLAFLPPKSARQGKDSTLRLFYQPLYVSANRLLTPKTDSSERYVSRSHAMQPDFVLEFDGRLIVFDAKLRTYSAFGSEQEDIDKMHAYRDGIVRRAGQSLRPAVSAAWCLFPGSIEDREQRTEDRKGFAGIRAYPAPTEAAPFGNGEIGAIRLRPLDENSQEILQELLTLLL